MGRRYKNAGRQLKKIRKSQNLTLREVCQLSKKLAASRRDANFLVPLSRLSDIESSGITPSIHKLYALALIYNVSLSRLLALYGVAKGVVN